MTFLRKTILILALPLAMLSAAATPNQSRKVVNDKPDMERIKTEVTDPSSRYFYPKLMKKYESNDTTMNLDEFRHLYLGTVFQEDYDPYRPSPFENRIEELYYKKEHTRAELDSIINFAEALLLDDPFDLQQMNYLIFALRNRGKTHRANIWQYRLNNLLAAILSTGTGADADNAWVIIDPKHEYNIINFHNSVAQEPVYVEPYYEYITAMPIGGKTAKAADREPRNYYFNLRYILEEYYRKHPDQLDPE